MREVDTSTSTAVPSVESAVEVACSASYMTPWVTVFAMFLLYTLLLLYFCKSGKKMCMPTPDNIFPYKKILKQLSKELSHLLLDDVFIELTDQKLGQGAAGFVFKGVVYPHTQSRYKHKTPAAIKMSYPLPAKSMALLEEAARQSRLSHPHIVRLVAVSSLSFSALRPMLAFEWLPGGSLAEFFNFQVRVNEETVYIRDIVRILSQVASALQYLHEVFSRRTTIKIDKNDSGNTPSSMFLKLNRNTVQRDLDGSEMTHRDVAARNVLLTSTDISRCDAKLGDFGLPMDLAGGCRLPVQWLPPEIISAASDRPGRHRPEADVWMFGVLAWECATLGAEPHFHRSLPSIQAAILLPDRGLPCPPACPAIFYDLVSSCLGDAYRRPSFTAPSSSSSSIPFRLRQLSAFFEHSQHAFDPVPNTSTCICSEHRCRFPQQSFGVDI